MCLVTTQKEPLIAEEDMEVFKVLGSNMTAPYYSEFQYKMRIVYGTEMKRGDVNYYDYHEESYFEDNKIDNVIAISEGFHSVRTEERIGYLSSNTYVYHAVIPKGSLYYESPTGLLVSNRIMISGHTR